MFQKETLFILAFTLLSSASWAAPHRGAINPELIEAYNQVKAEKSNVELTAIIPPGIEQMNSDQAIRSMADRGIGEWWKVSGAKESTLGKKVEKAEKAMNQEVNLSNANSEVQHKLMFQLNAFQTRAEMKYIGFSNANVYYQASSSTVGMEISEDIFNQKLILSHELKSKEAFSQMSLNWSW